VLEISELYQKKDYLVCNLSYGEKKKVEILLLFLDDSKLIILDEPFYGLD